MPEKLLMAEDVSDVLNVTVNRVYELARTGILPGVVRLGRQVRFKAGAVEDFINNGGQALEGGWKRNA
ncbi:MAG: helix-turn-helix domain-containing protein [Bacillota bacterium]|nr:helix-turn-helix domain-containing protein [Bacillota bacterium]